MSVGLRPRPEVPPEVREAVRRAVDQVLAAAPRAAVAANSWRFSGRWFSAHPVRRRRRPG